MLRQSVVFAIKLFLLLLVALNAGNTTARTARDPLKSPPKNGESAVVISITGNTAEVGAFTQVVLKRSIPEAGKKSRPSYVLDMIGAGLSRNTTFFVGALPAGEYELSTLTDFSTGKYLVVNPGMREAIGRFTVQQGKSSDLGRLIVTPLNFNVLLGRSALITSNIPVLQRFSPEHAKLFSGEVSSWDSPRNPLDRVEEYARSNPVGANIPTELPDGSIVAGSRLGTVLLRSPEGRWRGFRSNSLESIAYVLPVSLPDADFLAVGEFSTFLKKSRQDNLLVPMDSGDLPPGNLLYIDGNEKIGWYIAHQQGNQIALYHSAKLEQGKWTAVRKESIAAGFWSGGNAFWIWRTKTGLAYAVSQGSIYFLDYSTGLWLERKAPNKNRLISIDPNPNNTLGILTSPGGGFGGVFANSYLSKDDGQTWKEIKSPFKVNVSTPHQTKDGTVFVVGGVFGKPELHSSNDEGTTWKRVSEFQLSNSLVLLPSGGLLSISNGAYGLFSIQHSADAGLTWKTEYSNFNRAALEAQKK